MNILKYFKELFSKNKPVFKEVNVTDLRKWDFISTRDIVIRLTTIDEVCKNKSNLNVKLWAEALTGVSERIKDNWIEAWEQKWPSFAIELRTCLKKQVTVSRSHSDRQKAYIANNFAHCEKWACKEEFNSWMASH
jgi:hypothetical protein